MSHVPRDKTPTGSAAEGGTERDLRETLETARESARTTGESLAEETRAEAESVAESAKEATASRLDHIVSALHASANELQHKEDWLADGIESIAEQIQGAVHHLESRDLDTLSREVTSFARRNPGAFLGGAVVLGFAVGRLASTPAPRHEPRSQVHRRQGEAL